MWHIFFYDFHENIVNKRILYFCIWYLVLTIRNPRVLYISFFNIVLVLPLQKCTWLLKVEYCAIFRKSVYEIVLQTEIFWRIRTMTSCSNRPLCWFWTFKWKCCTNMNLKYKIYIRYPRGNTLVKYVIC